METVYIVAIIVILLILCYHFCAKETYVTRAVDDTAARNPDPINFKYYGRKKDDMGMDGYDDYYENLMYANQHVLPPLEGAPAFQAYPEITMPRKVPDAERGYDKQFPTIMV